MDITAPDTWATIGAALVAILALIIAFRALKAIAKAALLLIALGGAVYVFYSLGGPAALQNLGALTA